MQGLFALWIMINAFVRSESTTAEHARHCDSKSPGKTIKKNGDIILGGLFPVHVTRTRDGAGYFALNQYALTWVEAMMFAVQEINDNTKLLANVTIGYDIRDSCNRVSTALEASLDFALGADGRVNASRTELGEYCLCEKRRPSISAVIGGAASPISTNIANVFSVDMTPQISYSSTSILLSNKEVYPSFFRTLPSDTYQAKAIADVLRTFGWNYVSIVASDSAYGRAGMDALLRELKGDSICTAIEAIFHPDLDKDELHRIITSLKNEPRSKVVILWCQRPNALGFLEQATKLGLTGRTWIGTETWGDAYQLKNLSAEIVGGMLGIVPRLERNDGFEGHLQQLTPHNSMNNPWMWGFWQEEYGCFQTNRSDSSPASLVYQPENFTITCPQSASDKGLPNADSLPRNKYTNVMDAVYAVAHAVSNILNCNNGSGLLEGGNCPKIQPGIEPRDISLYLSNVSFHGKSNYTVMFDGNGDLLYGSYSVKILQPSMPGSATAMDFLEVGYWSGSDGRLHMEVSNVSLLWNGWSSALPISRCADACASGHYAVQGSPTCCWTCVPCERNFIQERSGQTHCRRCQGGYVSNKQRTACVRLRENYLRWDSAEGIAVLTLNFIAIALTAIVIVIFIRKRRTAVVKASNQELSFLHLGSICSIFAIPFLQSKPTPTLCCVRTFLFAISFTLCTSIMLLKTDRLLRIFRSRSRLSSRSRLLTNKMQIVMAACLTLLPVLFSIVWFLAYPPEIAVTADSTAEDTVVHECDGYVDILQLILLGYVLILALLCTYFAFKARTLPENFNEARFIGFAMFSFCLFWMSFVPVFQDTSGATKSSVYALTVMASGFAVVAIMYAPKLNVMLWHPDENTTEAFRIKTTATIMRGEGLSAASPSPRGSSPHLEVLSDSSVQDLSLR